MEIGFRVRFMDEELWPQRGSVFSRKLTQPAVPRRTRQFHVLCNLHRDLTLAPRRNVRITLGLPLEPRQKLMEVGTRRFVQILGKHSTYHY
jgi:hypothetical protein